MSIGAEATFSSLAERHRRELHIHCYRMLGSFDEAEDLVQESLLRAWRHRNTLKASQGFRPWLYRIATNCCLDELRRRSRRPPPGGTYADIPWLQPYPDRLLDELAPSEQEPEAVAVRQETIELAYVAAIQLLAPRQRAALILRDVLGFSAAETARQLDCSVPAANSALQRARARLDEQLPASARDQARGPELTTRERELLRGLIETHEQFDPGRAVTLLTDDVRVTMPPNPFLYEGLAQVEALMHAGAGEGRPGDWRLVPVTANRQLASASYLRQWGDTEFRAFKIDVYRLRDGRVAEITTFGNGLFEAFGLAPLLNERPATST